MSSLLKEPESILFMFWFGVVTQEEVVSVKILGCVCCLYLEFNPQSKLLFFSAFSDEFH